MSLSVAVVGSGPGGMYIVQALLEREPGCRIDVIERLPSPFGLIRGGVRAGQNEPAICGVVDGTVR